MFKYSDAVWGVGCGVWVSVCFGNLAAWAVCVVSFSYL